jgi:predicted RNA-binding Zn ribbon-like protein
MEPDPRLGRPSSNLALELARTRSARGTDRLASAGELARWLEERRELLGDPEADTALRLVEFRALREAVTDLLEAVVEGRPAPPDAVRRVNELSAAVPTWLCLDATDPRRPVSRRSTASAGRASQILAAVATSTIALVGGNDRERLRRCPAPGCGRFFLAGRRAAVWCSAACGNRVRVARHHARRRAAAGISGAPSTDGGADATRRELV